MPTPSATLSAAAAPTGSVFRWGSPIPYLFVGIALMLALIGFALIILALSYKKPFSPVNQAGDVENQEKSSSSKYRRVIPPPEMEPKIVIVMPGDLNPTYLATPIPKLTPPVTVAAPQEVEEVFETLSVQYFQ